MGNPILTSLFLIVAGTLFFYRRDWIHRWIGFMLVSAGLNIAAGMSDYFKYIEPVVVGVWWLMIAILCLIGFFEDPKKGT